MRHLLKLPLAVLLVCSCREKEQTPAKPGEQAAQQQCIEIGSGVPAFSVAAIAGPDKGKSLCYV